MLLIFQLTMTRLTSETALRGMPQRNMTPNISSIISAMVTTTTSADRRSNPNSRNTITNTAASDMPKIYSYLKKYFSYILNFDKFKAGH